MAAPLTELTKIKWGPPGAPGAGVTPSEKASFVTVSGANQFTNINTIHKNSTAALTVEKEDGTDVFVVDTTNKEVEVQNSGKLRGFSDANTTETFSIDAATGNAQLDGSLTIGGRVIGEAFAWSYVIDGGGSTIATGVKPDIVVPCNATLLELWGLPDQSGSIQIDLWRDSYANYPPTVGDSIISSEKLVITSATKGQRLSLNGGNGIALTGKQIIRPNVDSVTTITRITVVMVGVKA